MLLPSGGVIDDLIVYFLSETWYRLVVNAGTRDKDLAWIRRHAADFKVTVNERQDLAHDRRAGSECAAKTAALLLPRRSSAAVLDLKPFFGAPIDSWFVARTGYTGEDGFEVMMPAARCRRTSGEAARAGREAGGIGGARYLATGGRHESLRQRHG